MEKIVLVMSPEVANVIMQLLGQVPTSGRVFPILEDFENQIRSQVEQSGEKEPE